MTLRNKLAKLLLKQFEQDTTYLQDADKILSLVIKEVLKVRPEDYKYDEETHRYINEWGGWASEDDAMSRENALAEYTERIRKVFK